MGQSAAKVVFATKRKARRQVEKALAEMVVEKFILVAS
jgi:hypothetical protein